MGSLAQNQLAEQSDHLLFDIGYSYGLLQSALEVLKEIAQCDDYPVAVAKLIDAMEQFQAGRLQLRHEIYDNAAAVVQKALAARDRTE
jgi:hypothetical protein